MSRMLFGPDGKLYVSTFGEPGEAAQDPVNYARKILRLNDDGSAPSDDPFVGRKGYHPEIYTLGRNPRAPVPR